MAYCNHHTLRQEGCKDESRIEKLKNLMKQQDIEAVVIESEVNRRYLTGSKISKGLLLVTEVHAVLLVDFRFYEQARVESDGCEIRLSQDTYRDAVSLLKDMKVKSCQIEKHRMTVAELERLKDMAGEKLVMAEESADRLMDGLRAVKDERELMYFRQAQEITDKAYEHMNAVIRPGMSQTQLKVELGTYMVGLGSENYSMDFMVLCGANTAYPHGCAGDAVVKNGDFVMMDFGGMAGGYSADMTRTVAVGNITEEMKLVYDIVLEAQKRSIEAIRPGVTGMEVDKAARDYICQCGYGPYFGHGLGHSLGLEIHEDPRCNESCKAVLKPGMMMTVEPGIYLPGKFGVRIEDMGVVTEDGFENMTKSFK